MSAGRILVGSYGPPRYDRDSGSRRLSDLIELLIADGWTVTFLAANPVVDAQYAHALEHKGVSIIDGSVTSLADVQAAMRFEVALLAYWPVAELYLSDLRRHAPDTTVLVDSVDIHFLRETRRAFQWDGGAGRLDEELGLEMVGELNTYRAADGVLTVSDKEAALLADFGCDDELVHVVPDIEHAPDEIAPLHSRRGMVFVGSFRHTPNVDAVAYLCREIVPRLNPALLAEHPVSIIGDGLDDTVRRLGAGLPHVHMVGWVPEIAPYLQAARVSLAPLRFGAGTKRKVVQALMAGTPCVCTSTSAEGLDLRSGEDAFVADDPEQFVQCVERLLTDDEVWHRLSRGGQRVVAGTHSASAVAERLRAAVDVARRRPRSHVVPTEGSLELYRSRLVHQETRLLVTRLREALDDVVGADACVLVATGGADELLRIGHFGTSSFPSAGVDMESAGAVVAALEEQVDLGATHLLLPNGHGRLLERQPDLGELLRERYDVVLDDPAVGRLYGLARRARPT